AMLHMLVIPAPPVSTLFPYTTLFRSRRLAGRVRAVGRQRRLLGESPLVPKRPVDFIRRNMQKPPYAPSAGHLEQDMRAHHVGARSEEHTSELQSRENLVCRLLLEKKK